jgi:hypothetical protein
LSDKGQEGTDCGIASFGTTTYQARRAVHGAASLLTLSVLWACGSNYQDNHDETSYRINTMPPATKELTISCQIFFFLKNASNSYITNTDNHCSIWMGSTMADDGGQEE